MPVRGLLLRLARLVLGSSICRRLVHIVDPPKVGTLPPSSSSDDGIKVILCGFCRNGTTSLKEALGSLGFPCYHGKHFFALPGHSESWWQAAREGKTNWRHILHGYRAIADFPATQLYKQLMAEYPDAKVILNVRDPERWYRSCLETVIWAYNRVSMQLSLKDSERNFFERLYFQGIFSGRFAEKEFAINVYSKHVEDVKKYVPKERLLVYEVKEGWAPLCKFLQVNIPNTPFPNENDAVQFRNRVLKFEAKFAVCSALYAGLMSCAFALIINRAFHFFV